MIDRERDREREKGGGEMRAVTELSRPRSMAVLMGFFF